MVERRTGHVNMQSTIIIGMVPSTFAVVLFGINNRNWFRRMLWWCLSCYLWSTMHNSYSMQFHSPHAPCNGPSSLCIVSLAEDSCTSPDISIKMHHPQFEPFRTIIADWPRSQTFIANLGEASGGISDQISKSDLKVRNIEISRPYFPYISI